MTYYLLYALYTLSNEQEISIIIIIIDKIYDDPVQSYPPVYVDYFGDCTNRK